MEAMFSEAIFSLKASSSSSVKATIETGSSFVAEVLLLVSLPSVFFSFANIYTAADFSCSFKALAASLENHSRN